MDIHHRRIAILGVTGFLGRGLPSLLADRGWSVTGVTRNDPPELDGVDEWVLTDEFQPAGFDAVINLAGAPIDQRWTLTNKQEIWTSRVDFTRRLVDQLVATTPNERPKVLLNASAVGIYGDRQDEFLTEDSSVGSGFLAEVSQAWEAATHAAAEADVRVANIRTSMVLGKKGPAFQKLHRIFRSGLAGRLGDGRQWMPWIHVDDWRAAVIHVLESADRSGPFNACAPHSVRNREFTRHFANATKRIAIIPVPKFALKLALGGFGEELLSSQRAVPEVLLESGFVFQYPTLEKALADLLTGT